MYRAAVQIDFAFGHRIHNYQGKCSYLHGHNGRVRIELAAKGSDEREMVHKFGEIEAKARTWIDQHLDHRTLLHREDPLARLLASAGEPVVVMDGNPSAENIAELIYREIRGQGLPVERVQFWETPTSSSIYRG